ncbi:cyclodeaminase/cyclohydrolase family protein [Helicovermis profundi]|uniref:Cyclodeaminase/cyclohydrolase family protein n=1 Tax=Helicovermis profundi TaxID=3065157 RepID=A0AAU9ENP9_9FIRM|nr:cyclodeaminase/cyclohydrolase family protein [Clostridia bacterium S502]
MLVDLTVKNFLDELESNAPVPGGGSVAALSAGISASLVGMVANLTIGKKKYVKVEDDMKQIAADISAFKDTFVDLVDKDASSFDDFMKAMKLPKESEEEKKIRTEEMQRSIKYAASVPLSCADEASKMFDMIESVVVSGNQNAVTDGAVAAMMARTAILSALLNVKINMGSIKDEAYLAELKIQVDRLEEIANRREKEILSKVNL